MNKPVLYIESNTLCHYGIKGQQWGRRLYQNKDGSLTAAGKIRYGDKKSNARVKGYDFLGPSVYAKSKGLKDGKTVLYTYAQNSKRPSRAYTMDSTEDNLNGIRTTLKPAYLSYEKGQYKYEPKGEVGANVSDDTLRKLVTSNYDDLSDNDLDTLYQLSGDKDVLKYRMQRTAKVVAAGKKYAESSAVSRLLQTAVAKIADIPELVEKGAKTVAKMVDNGFDTLKAKIAEAAEERKAQKAAEKAAAKAKIAAQEAKKERIFNKVIASRAR